MYLMCVHIFVDSFVVEIFNQVDKSEDQIHVVDSFI